ncbi:MAG: hypothetical protein AAGC93_10175 [Cyanobacteria bacterium P01_F01_bin.53]
MKSFREPTANTLPPLSISLPIAVDLTVSLGTMPLLVLLTSGRAITSGLAELGAASEEVFRGEQLPVLPLLPIPQETEPSSETIV